MSFSYVKIKELKDFSTSSFNLKGYRAAITPWRALSQTNNPYADPEDIVLVLKKNERGQICGYIGALPFSLQHKNGEKFAWISGWRVYPEAKKGLSYELLENFVQNYDHRIMFSDMPSVKLAEKIQKAAGAVIKERKGFYIWLRFNLSKKLIAFSKKKKIYHKLYLYSGTFYLLFILEKLLNIFFHPLFSLISILNEPKHLVMEKTRYPDEDDFRFILENAGKDVYIPSLQELKWYNNYPWLIKKDKNNSFIGAKYYFSSFAGKNEICWLRIRHKDHISGMVCLSIRDGVARTQYVYIRAGEEYNVCKMVLCFLFKKLYITDIISYQNAFVDSVKTILFPYLRMKKLKRYYGVSNKLLQITGLDFTMQDGSGDYVFT